MNGTGKRQALGRWLGPITLVATLVTASASAGASPVSVHSPSVLARIRASVARTERAGTAHFVTKVSASPLSRPGSVQHLTTVGDIQFSRPNVSLVTSVASPSSTPSLKTAQIYLGKALYIRYLNPEGAPSSHWSHGVSGHFYPYLGAVEPAALVHAQGPVKTVGINVIDGHPATEYAVAVPAITDSLAVPGSKTQYIEVRPFILDVWLNRSGVIVCTSATQIATGNGSIVSGRTVITLSGFGEPVHISAPVVSS